MLCSVYVYVYVLWGMYTLSTWTFMRGSVWMAGVLGCQTAGAGTGFFVRQMLRAEKLIPEDHEEPPIVPLPADHVGAYLGTTLPRFLLARDPPVV